MMNRNGKPVKDQLEGMAENAMDDVKDFAEDAGRAMREAGRDARKGADDMKKDFVSQLNNAAKNIRKEARERGVEGDAFNHVDNMAKGMEKAAQYLHWNSYEDIGDDIEKKAKKVVKNNPTQLMAVVLLVGIVVGLILRGNKR